MNFACNLTNYYFDLTWTSLSPFLVQNWIWQMHHWSNYSLNSSICSHCFSICSISSHYLDWILQHSRAVDLYYFYKVIQVFLPTHYLCNHSTYYNYFLSWSWGMVVCVEMEIYHGALRTGWWHGLFSQLRILTALWTRRRGWTVALLHPSIFSHSLWRMGIPLFFPLLRRSCRSLIRQNFG